MEIVVPLRVERLGTQPFGIVAFVFEHEVDVTLLADPRANLGSHGVEEIVIGDRMDRVEPQPVDPIFLQPHQRVVDEEAVCCRYIDRNRAAPGCMHLRMEERARIGAEVVPVGAEVVVDDVEEHADPSLVRGIDQRLQLIGCAKAFRGGIGRAPRHSPSCACR